MRWVKDFKKWILGYLINLGTFIISVSASGILLLHNTNILMGVFYFSINLLVGSTVWRATNKLTFKKSFVCTFIFYASLAICGIIVSLAADTLLDMFRDKGLSVMEFLRISFYCLVVSLIPALILNSWLYVGILSYIPEMCDQFLSKLSFYVEKEIKKNLKGGINKKKKGKKV